jgi:hypothetical protein
MAFVNHGFDFAHLRQMHEEPDPRLVRPVRIHWGAVFGGVIIGWGCLFLLSLIGGAIGLASADPFSARPLASLDARAAVWGGIELAASSILGAWLVVRLSGDRRRTHALAHGAIAWGLSVLTGAMLAIAAANTAAQASAPTGARNIARREANGTPAPARMDRIRAEEARDNATKAGGAGAFGGALGLACSLLGGLWAASAMSGRGLRNALNKRAGHGAQRPSTGMFDQPRAEQPRSDQSRHVVQSGMSQGTAGELTRNDRGDNDRPPIILPPTQH